MTDVTTHTGALSQIETDWHSINWKKVYQNVRRLQARIVKAVKELEVSTPRPVKRALRKA